MIEKLFKFPIVMVDGKSEEEKEDLSKLTGEQSEVDVIFGEAECPFYDFLSIADRWLPTEESLENAKNGKFDACYVIFDRSGEYVVPWTKNKFKRELSKFSASVTQEKTSSLVVTKEEFLKMIKDGIKQDS